MMKPKLVIFDFDGTLADTLTWFISVSDELADKFRIKRLDHGQIEELRGMDARKMMRHHGVAWWKLPLIARYLQRYLAQDIHKVSLFDGMDVLLEKLVDQGVQLAVLSSNSYQNITGVLGSEITGRIRYFECGVSMFGKPKKMQKILRQSGVMNHEAVCIGDEIRDIEAAKRVRIPFGAVAWGYTKIEALQAHAPDWVFTTVDELAAELTY